MEKSQAAEQLVPEELGEPTEQDIESLLDRMDGGENEEEVSEADELEADDGEQEDGDEEAEQEEEQPVSDDWKAKEYEVNGEKVSGAELASGYMKDADYRRKTAEVAQLRREAEQVIQGTQSEYATRINRLDALAGALYQEIVGDQSQLASLVESDPAEYLRRSHYIAQRNQLLQQAMAERDAVGKQQGALSQQQLAQYVREESQKLIEALPDWKDQRVAEAESKELTEYLLGTGFDANELSELYDHRALILARKAMLYDKRANMKPVQNKQQSVNVKPGAPNQTPHSNKRREQLKARAYKTNDRDDFAAAIEAYL